MRAWRLEVALFFAWLKSWPASCLALFESVRALDLAVMLCVTLLISAAVGLVLAGALGCVNSSFFSSLSRSSARFLAASQSALALQGCSAAGINSGHTNITLTMATVRSFCILIPHFLRSGT